MLDEKDVFAYLLVCVEGPSTDGWNVGVWQGTVVLQERYGRGPGGVEKLGGGRGLPYENDSVPSHRNAVLSFLLSNTRHVLR